MADDKNILISVSIDSEALKVSKDKALSEITGLDKKLTQLKANRQKELEFGQY